MQVIYLLFLFFLSACCSSKGYLNVQTVYVTREYLASYYVGSPDPALVDPPLGQKLFISWGLSREDLQTKDVYLHITIRLKNHQDVVIDKEIDSQVGSYTYNLLNEGYFESQGILTYKVELIMDGEVIEERRHQLWHELIDVTKKHECSD